MSETTHEGPVVVRFSRHRGRDYYSVLCPVGHLVTAGAITPQTWPGSAIEAKIASHQTRRDWHVVCDGAVAQA
jgi:hypothetical protein